jgi:NTE family protein
LLVEPDGDDSAMFFTNEFSFASRRELAAHAYTRTLSDFRHRQAEVNLMLARHGLKLNASVLADSARTIWTGLQEKPMRRTATTSKLTRALEDLERLVAQK